MSCAAWGTPAALAAHGPCLNDPGQIAKRRGKRAPQVNEYPLDFQAAYRAAEPLQQTTPAQARAMVRGLFDRVAVPEE